MDETQGFLSNTEPADRQSTNTTGHRDSHLQGHAAAADAAAQGGTEGN